MPKKQGEWHQMSKPTTPSQINNFFDMCTKWLVGIPSNETFPSLEATNAFAIDRKIETENFVFSRIDVNDNTLRKCFFCDSTRHVKMHTANPFTRKNQIFVCKECFF